VVLNIAFGKPVIAVDTHIFRVSNRIPLAPVRRRLTSNAGLRKSFLPRSSSSASLADSAWPVYLQGPPPRLPALSDFRFMPMDGQDGVTISAVIRRGA